jgi:hypothetical protein
MACGLTGDAWSSYAQRLELAGVLITSAFAVAMLAHLSASNHTTSWELSFGIMSRTAILNLVWIVTAVGCVLGRSRQAAWHLRVLCAFNARLGAPIALDMLVRS